MRPDISQSRYGEDNITNVIQLDNHDPLNARGSQISSSIENQTDEKREDQRSIFLKSSGKLSYLAVHSFCYPMKGFSLWDGEAVVFTFGEEFMISDRSDFRAIPDIGSQLFHYDMETSMLLPLILIFHQILIYSRTSHHFPSRFGVSLSSPGF